MKVLKTLSNVISHVSYVKYASAALIGVILASNTLTGFSNFKFQISNSALAAASYNINFAVDKAQAKQGETVTYELIVTNNGDVNLSNVNIYEASRPGSTTYVNGSSIATKNGTNYSIADAWYSDAGGTNLGALTPGQSLTFKWAVTINNDAAQDTDIENVINLKTAELQTPQVYSVSFHVAANASRNSLCATKTVDKSTANVGDTVTYTIKICNDGDINQDNVTLYDRLPSQLTYVAGSTRAASGGNTVTVNDGWIGSTSGGSGTGYNMGRLSTTQFVTVTFQATVNSTATNGQVIENFAQANSSQHPEMVTCAVPLKINVPVPPAGNPNCSLTKKVRLPNGNEQTSVSASDHLYAPGEQIVYRLFISNSGNADASNVSISDFLPPYVTWVSGDGGYAANDNKVNFDLGTLKASESRTLTYNVKVRDDIPSGQVNQQNNAKVTSPSAFSNCTAQSTLVIGKPGAVLAAATLPQTGTVPPSVLATLGLVGTGFALRLRKVKVVKNWDK